MAAQSDAVPAVVRFVSNPLIAILILRDLISDVANKAAILQHVSLECGKIESAWSKLWCEVDDDSSDDATVRRKSLRLARRLSEVTAHPDFAGVRVDRKLNEKCEEAAYRVIRDRYAV